MLLDFMRRNTRNLLIATIVLIVPAFVLWGAFPTMGQKGRRTLLKVGGEEVSLEEFANYYQNIREVARQNLGANYTPELEKALNLKRQALDRTIREVLLSQEIERLNIVVSDEEVEESFKTNPAFFTDGEFDPARWNASLGDPRINWAALIEQQREKLRIIKLVEMIRSEARVTEAEMQGEYRRQHEKMGIEFITFKASELTAKVQISSDDLAFYYERHKQQYAEPARVKLAYVELKKEPSPMDFADVEQYVNNINILERARGGEDFAELAETYSDDTATKSEGGDLGFFGRGRMVKEFEKAAFSMKPGEISELIQSPFGYHIIKVEETKGKGAGKEVRARHILFKVEPTEDTLYSLEKQAVQLSLGARDSTLEQAASEMGMTFLTTSKFVETSAAIPTIGVVPEITEILPGLEKGRVSDVIETRTAFFIVQVAEREPERIPDLSEVEDKVRAAIKIEKALDLAKTMAEEIVRDVNEKGLSLDDIASAPEAQETAPFTRRGYPPELPFLNGLVSAAFELTQGQTAGPFVGDEAAYVIWLKEKIAPDPAGYDDQKQSIENRLLVERKEQVFEDYYENLRKKVEVKIDESLLQAV